MKTLAHIFTFSFLVLLTACSPGNSTIIAPENTTETVENISNELPNEVKTDVNETSESSNYQTFSAEKLIAKQGQARFGIFFSSHDCLLCAEWSQFLRNSLPALSANAIVMEANFDMETHLRKKYGVVEKGEVLLFDETGELIEKQPEPSVKSLQAFFR